MCNLPKLASPRVHQTLLAVGNLLRVAPCIIQVVYGFIFDIILAVAYIGASLAHKVDLGLA